MVSVRTKHTEIRRLDKTHRHLSASAKKRSDVHKAKANATRKQTYAERKARKQDLDEHNQNVKEDMQLLRGELLDMCGTLVKKHGRTKEYWLTELVQAERIAKTQRSKNRWNAFVSMRMTQINAGLPPGAPKKKIGDPEVTAQIKGEWEKMSSEEAMAATEERFQQLIEDSKTKRTGQSNSSIAEFHDAVANLKYLEDKCAALHVRTGMELLFIAVRSSENSWMRPYVMVSSPRVENCFYSLFNQTTDAFATKLEGFCLGGYEGLKDKYQEEISTLKMRCTLGVLAQLNDLLAPNILGRMEYTNFYEKITLRYHVVFEDWPIARFCTPGHLGLLELRTLYQALLDDKPLFRHVPDDEWDKLDLAAVRRLYNSFSPTIAQPLRVSDDDVNGGEPSGSAGGEPFGFAGGDSLGLSGGESSGPTGGGSMHHNLGPAPQSSASSSQQHGGTEDNSTPPLPPLPPPRGGTQVSFGQEQHEAPPKQRARRANAGMSRQAWALKKAEAEAEKKAARQAQLEKARNGQLAQARR